MVNFLCFIVRGKDPFLSFVTPTQLEANRKKLAIELMS